MSWPYNSHVIRTCPKCDYNLTGLPEEYTCPECGFAYDAHATSVHLPTRRANRSALIVGALNLFVVCWFWGRRVAVTDGWFLVAIFALFVLALIGRWRKDALAPVRMLLTGRGIMLHSDASTSPPVAWTEVQSARCSWWDGKLRVEQTNGGPPIVYSHQHLGGVRAGKRCAAEINRLKRVYSMESLAVEGADDAGRAE